MRLTPIIIVGSLLVAGAAFAQNTTTISTPNNPPNGPASNMPPVAGGNTPNAVAGPNNSTGNLDRPGAGLGTTGTGSKGGSGNE